MCRIRVKGAATQIDGFTSGGKYILYRNIIDNLVDKVFYKMDIETGVHSIIDIPEGYRPACAAVWNTNKTEAAFYAMNENAEFKLYVYNCEVEVVL